MLFKMALADTIKKNALLGHGQVQPQIFRRID